MICHYLSTQNNTLLRSSIYLSDIYLKNGPNEPFIRVTLVPCATNPNESFALVYQLSHTAGDGATYYKLMEMLCSEDKDEDDNDTNFVELIPERIKESKKIQIDILGATEENFLTSFGFSLMNIWGMIKNQLKGHIPVEYAFINPVHVETHKQSSSGKVGSGKVVPYVSTNDILTSHILTKSKSVYGMMAINWRNRLEGHTTLHAGNYENFIFYRKQDAIAPELIRFLLQIHVAWTLVIKVFESYFVYHHVQKCMHLGIGMYDMLGRFHPLYNQLPLQTSVPQKLYLIN